MNSPSRRLRCLPSPARPHAAAALPDHAAGTDGRRAEAAPRRRSSPAPRAGDLTAASATVNRTDAKAARSMPGCAAPSSEMRLQTVGAYMRFNSFAPELRLNEFAILITAREWTFAIRMVCAPLARHEGRARPDDRRRHWRLGKRPRGHEGGRSRGVRFLHRNFTATRKWTTRRSRGRKTLFGEKGVMDLIGVSGYYTAV